VHTLIDELLYPQHPLGWEVAGREQVVLAMDADALRAFMTRNYAPGRSVVALAGRLVADEAIAAVQEQFAFLGAREAPAFVPAPQAGKVRAKVVGKRAEQTHLCIGWRTVPTDHPDKFTVDMLNAVLGEGMSSRLFLELREKRGLAYDVRMELRLEDTRGVSSWLAGQELFLGRVRTVEEVCAIIDGIGPDDIQRAARTYLRPELAYVAAVGPRASIAAVAPPAAEPVAMGIAS